MGDIKKDEITHPSLLKLPSGIIVTNPTTIQLLTMSSRNTKIPDETVKSINSIVKGLLNGTDSNGWRKIPTKNHFVDSNTTTFRSKNFNTYSTNKTHYQHSQPNRQQPNQVKYPYSKAVNNQSTDYRPAPQKYVSRFQNSEKTMDSQILNTIILGKLNKFSHQNYNEIKEFLEQILDSGQTDFLKDFMKLVFEKGATEPIFCPLYARLLGELSKKYVILITEMEILYNSFINIFDEISEESTKSYDEILDANNEKTYRLGYSQFLTELMPYSVVKPEFLIKVIQTILDNSVKVVRQSNKTKVLEEYIDCLLRILKSVSEKKNSELGMNLFSGENNIIGQIKVLSVKNPEFKSQSAKARFSCVDIIELLNV